MNNPEPNTFDAGAPSALPDAAIKRRTPELLAPAGTMASLHAAVQAGADAVYLGAGSFNARRGAENFTLGTLREACDYAHLRGRRIYLTLNTIILPSEVPDALELARQAYRAGVDAFIVQDIGLAAELSRTLPETRLHISTQMNTHSVAGLEAAARLGASRVTLARELSLPEIAHLCAAAVDLGMEIEVFGHGALCVCYSGQCLLSSMIGGRSANRGLCAQACRLPYTLHNKALRKTLAAEGDHLLSPKDLCTADLLPELQAAGIASLKIEGRMKSPEYVHTVTAEYRRALDGAGAADPAALAEAFSRGFTTAYLEAERGNSIMSYGRPNNRGVFAGRVASVDGAKVAIAPEIDLHTGDLLEFWTHKGNFTQEVGQIGRDAQGRVVIACEKRPQKGDRVFRVRNAALAYTDDACLPRVAIEGVAKLRIGQPLKLRFWTAGAGSEERPAGSAGEDQSARHPKGSADDGGGSGEEGTARELEGVVGERSNDVSGPGKRFEASFEGDVVEAARTKAVSEEDVRAHIDRLGGTPFELAGLTVVLDEGVGIGFSQLHKARAQALDELQEAILAPYHARTLNKIPAAERASARKQGPCSVAVFATNPACARAAKRAGADLVYVPALHYKRGEAEIAGQISETAEQAGYPKQSIIALPAVMHDDVPGSREHACGFDAMGYVSAGKPVLVENLGELRRAKEAGALPEIGSHLPLVNGLSLQQAVVFGAERVWLSPELSLVQIEELAQDSPVPLGITVMGAQELMVTEHCMLMSQGPCNEDCANCQRRKSPHYLKDRKGYEFPVVTDLCGRSHLFNAVPLDNAHAIPELVHAGVTAFMVDATLMNVAETTEAVRRTVRARDIAVKSGDAVSKKQDTTSGLLYRGVQ